MKTGRASAVGTAPLALALPQAQLTHVTLNAVAPHARAPMATQKWRMATPTQSLLPTDAAATGLVAGLHVIAATVTATEIETETETADLEGTTIQGVPMIAGAQSPPIQPVTLTNKLAA